MIDLTELTLDEMKVLAEEMDGFEYDKRWGEDKLRDALVAFFEENPVEEEPQAEATPEAETPVEAKKEEPPKEPDAPKAKAPKGTVNIKAETVRGELTTSAGKIFFDDDGIAEGVSDEAAEILLSLNGYKQC